MTYLKLYSIAVHKLETNQITLGEYEKMIEPLQRDIEPKTGHWIDTDEGFLPCECSECETVEFKKSNYCPNCGAKMQ